MGPYCNFCGRRCFVVRVIPDGPKKGWSGCLATCQRGMEHDLKETDHTHLTAINPVTAPEAAAAIAATVFPSLKAFYAARPERDKSGESDYGVHWQFGCRTWPQWRVSYVQATGEIYAVEQRGDCRVQVLGIVPPDPDERDEFPCTGRHYYRTLDRILDGWADPDVSGFDLGWVERKLAAYAVDSPPRGQ